MTVDPDSEWPLVAQLAQLLRATIHAAELAPGDKIPSENELVAEYRVSRATANRALAVLADEGLISRRRGTGSVVLSVSVISEVHPAPGARISARLPSTGERDSVGAGLWVPVLTVAEPGWPERLYPADSVIILT
jgi:DNA-binding GntR family transcriptional regulator